MSEPEADLKAVFSKQNNFDPVVLKYRLCCNFYESSKYTLLT